jgi:outer membrane protein assembly factor BamB
METKGSLSDFAGKLNENHFSSTFNQKRRESRKLALFCTIFLLLASAAQAVTGPSLLFCNKVSGTKCSYTNAYYPAPGTTIQILGTGFGNSTAVDVYFDSTDVALGVTSSTGVFVVSFQIPTNAAIGQHWISAVQRSDDVAAQQAIQITDNWSSFRYSAAHKADNYYETALNPDNVGNIDIAWSYLTGGMVFSSPAQLDTAGPALSAASPAHFDTYFTSFDSNVYDVDGVAGTKKWQYTTNGFVTTSPAVSGGIVYVGSSDNYLYALYAETGTLKWSFPTYNSVFSSPAVADGNVYFGSNDENVYAVNASTGSLAWSFPATNTVGASPAVYNGNVYIADDNAIVYALNTASGTQNWSDNLTYSCSVGTISSRLVRPPQYVGSQTVSSPSVSDGVVFIGYNNSVYALHGETGATIWSAQLSDQSCGVPSSPAVANGVLYIGSQDNNVYALNARNGTILWSYTTGGPIGSSPAVANGVVYVGSDDGNIYALNASTGALIWNFPTGSDIVSSPAVANGTLYVGSDDGNLYAFNLAGGQDTKAQGKVKVRRPDPASLHPDLSLKAAEFVGQSTVSR